MSSSDRNVEHNKFFDVCRPRENGAAQPLEELPNERIEVRIDLNQRLIPTELRNELQRNDMALTQPDRSMDIVIISGIQPVNGFGTQEVLQIVRLHARNAVLA